MRIWIVLTILATAAFGLSAQPSEAQFKGDYASARAVTVNVDPSIGVGGFVGGGDWVTVVLMRNVHGNALSGTVIPAIRVSRADYRNDGTISSVLITFEVDQSQANKLARAQQIGRLALGLIGYPPGILVPSGSEKPVPWWYYSIVNCYVCKRD